MKNDMKKWLLAAAIAVGPAFANTGLAQGGDVWGSGPGGDSMSMGSAAPTSSFEPFPGSIPPSQVSPTMLGQDIAITGEIIEVRPSGGPRSPTSVIFENRPGGAIQLVYWPELSAVLDPLMQVGSTVSVQGELGDYRGALQIRVKAPTQVRAAGMSASPARSAAESSNAGGVWGGGPGGGTAAAQPVSANTGGYTPIAQLLANDMMLEQEASIRGRIAEFRESWSASAPNIIKAQEDGAELEIVFWTAEDEVIPPALKQVGGPIFATGNYQDYRGRKQLNASKLQNVSAQPLAAERMAAAPRDLSNVSTESASSGWLSRSQIEERSTSDPFGDGPGGTANAWSPSQPAASSASATSAAAADAVGGTVNDPFNTGQAVMTTKSKDLTPAKVGSEVTVQGRVVRIAPVPGGNMLVLRDETGLVMVAVRDSLVRGTQAESVRIDDSITVKGTVRTDAQRRQVWVNLDAAGDLQFTL